MHSTLALISLWTIFAFVSSFPVASHLYHGEKRVFLWQRNPLLRRFNLKSLPRARFAQDFEGGCLT
jgi:hypothetical protein